MSVVSKFLGMVPEKLKPGQRISDSNLQPLDLLLSAISSALAVYAGAVSLASQLNAEFFAYLVIIGTGFSFVFIRLFGNTRAVTSDTVIYTVAAFVLGFMSTRLNTLLPENIYELQLVVPGVLSWMLAVGSFFVWRDQTMLFQAVPSIALFGLVGCYDTFRGAVFFFFGFLLCQATLLSRAHGRAMLRQASLISSESRIQYGEDAKSLQMAEMRRGPWRWMAGPEWALGSGFVIVLASLLGAPLLQQSASGISGIITYNVPINASRGPAVFSQSAAGVRIGNGPNKVSDIPVMRVTMPAPYYLRLTFFGSYENGRWSPRGQSGPPRTVGSPTSDRPTTTVVVKGRSVQTRNVGVVDNVDRQVVSYRIEPLQTLRGDVPAPGETVHIDEDRYSPTGSGAYTYSGWRRPLPPLNGYAVVYGGKAQLSDADRTIGEVIPDWTDAANIPADVVAFAQQVTRNAKTDYEKAVAIKQAIESRCLYNLNAEAVPAGVDPVSHFLFTSKQGYCDLFASTMVLMARAVGLPSRYTVGYIPFEDDRDEDGRYIVRQKHAHAWAEILFKNGGWVVFDATQGAEEVEGNGVGSDSDRPFYQRTWFLGTFLILASIASGIFLVRWGKKYLMLRRTGELAQRRERRKRDAIRRRLDRTYLAFERQVRKQIRRPRRPSETMMEYIRATETKLGSALTAVRSLAAAYSSAFYQQTDLNDEVVKRLAAGNQELRKGRIA